MYFNTMVRKPQQERKKGTPHVENGSDDPVENDDGEANVSCGPPRNVKRRNFVSNLAPVKCEDTHGHAVCNSEQLINHTIVGGYPADPGEAGESGKKVRR